MTGHTTPERRVHVPDMETALRLQRLEDRVETLTDKLDKNTLITEKILAAWEGSNATVSFIKGCAIFGAAVVAIVAGVNKIWGH